MWDLHDLPARGGKPRDQTIYTNAKVLLTGDSGAGKTGLAEQLIHKRFEATVSTDGVWATQLKLEEDGPIPEGIEREIWLWDFAGQADYRLIHQLYMDGTDLALLVFDPQKDNPFEGLAQWDQDLTRAAAGRPFVKRLVAGRCDRGGLRVSQGQVDEFQERRGFAGYNETSARTGDGCDELREAIAASIPWDRLPKTSSPTIFKRIKEEILKLKDAGRVLLADGRAEAGAGTADDRRAVQARDPADGRGAARQRGRGLAARLRRLRAAPARADQCLCRGAWCGRCAPTATRSAASPRPMCSRGNFPVPEGVKLERDDEDVVLRAMVETLLKRGLCLKETTGGRACSCSRPTSGGIGPS